MDPSLSPPPWVANTNLREGGYFVDTHGPEEPELVADNISNWDDAYLIEAVGKAAHDLPDEYDAVEAVRALPELIDVAEDLMPLLEIQSAIDHTHLLDILQKARKD